MRKRNIVLIAAAAAVGITGVIAGIVVNRRSAEVTSVAMLNQPYFGDYTSINGTVVNSSVQQVYASDSLVVSDLFVSDGQTVHTGDRLLAYDLTSLQIAVESAQLQIQETALNISISEKRLQTLQNTNPIVIPVPSPTPVPTVVPTPEPTAEPSIPEPLKSGEAWDALVSLDQAYQTDVPDDQTITEPADETGENTGEQPEEDITDETEKDDDKNKEIPSGSYSSPYKFLVQEEGTIYGSLFQEIIRKMNDAEGEEGSSSGVCYIQITATADNQLPDDTNVVFSWLIKVTKEQFNSCSPYDQWPAAAFRNNEETDTEVEEPDVEITVEEEQEYEVPEGYTAEELAELIAQEKENLRDLRLTLKRNQLDLEEKQLALDDGIVYARKDGVVTIDSMHGDNEPYLTVQGTGGLEIEGYISERLYNQISSGQTVYVSDWSTGNTFEASVMSVDTYPSTTDMYYSSDNSSVYAFHAYTAEQLDIQTGSWLDISLDSGSSDFYSFYSGYSDTIVLMNAYLRHDADGTYVMKEEDGRLVKSYVTTGSKYYGQYTEIRDGLELSDYIGFPYGKNAAEGTRTKHAEDDYYSDGEVEYTEEVYEDTEVSDDMETDINADTSVEEEGQ